MKTLYLSDLEDTLLRSEVRVSAYTAGMNIIAHNEEDGVARWLERHAL